MLQDLIASLGRAARSMKPGALFITLKQFPESEAPYFDLVEQVRCMLGNS